MSSTRSFKRLEEDEAEEQQARAAASMSCAEKLRAAVLRAVVTSVYYIYDALLRPVVLGVRFDRRTRSGLTPSALLRNAVTDVRLLRALSCALPNLNSSSMTPKEAWAAALLLDGTDLQEAEPLDGLAAALGISFWADVGANLLLIPYTGTSISSRNVAIAYGFAIGCWYLATKVELLAGVTLVMTLAYAAATLGNIFSQVMTVLPPLLLVAKFGALVLALSATYIRFSPGRGESKWNANTPPPPKDVEYGMLFTPRAQPQLR